MNAKKKAIELVLKFERFLHYDQKSNLVFHDPSPKNKDYHKRVRSDSKNLAIITVNELIKEETMWKNGDTNPVYYWNEVLKEIENI